MNKQIDLQEFICRPPQEFALLGLANGDLKIFFGPFIQSPEPVSGTCSVYFNNFRLNEPTPYYICQAFASVSAADRNISLESFKETAAPKINWKDETHIPFLKSYAFFRNLIDLNQIQKAVPIGFSRGVFQNEALKQEELSSLLLKLINGQPGLYSYAIKTKQQLVLGASPEILCEIDYKTRTVKTEAVAGSIIKTHAPLSDITGKLKEEHQLVVTDLEETLSEFGNVTKGEISLKSLSSLSHLKTDLQVEFNGHIDISSIIKKIHPSGALGILPRFALDHSYIEALDPGGRRGCFGAPFGAIFENGDATLIVAIRNLIIEGRNVFLAAGAGITRQSESNSELNEVIAKQTSVKNFFGLK